MWCIKYLIRKGCGEKLQAKTYADAAITFIGSKCACGDTDYLMDKLDKQVEDVIEGE